MPVNERLPKEKVNFFDGQKVTERDLDTEQIYHQKNASEIALDFHGSGVVNFSPFTTSILLDTSDPGQYSETENPSKLEIQGGNYDGKGIYLDTQPTDNVRGNRIAVELVNVDIIGRNKPKILIIGRTFDGLNSAGILNYEFLEFEKNTTKITQFYYQSIVAVFFNNFSGGLGKTENEASVESLDLISANSGYAIFREAEPLSVFTDVVMLEQTASPSFDFLNFITSSVSRSISDEISLILDASSDISELYFDLESKEQIYFEPNASNTVAYGEKFLCKTNNLQKIDLLLSVLRDDSRDTGEEYDWTGDLVLSIYKISGLTSCATDAVPDDLIEFDPDLNPLIEISFNQSDFESLGYKLNETPQVVSFNLASTLIADPNIDPSVSKDNYFAFLLTRRGDNSIGTVALEKGYENKTRKEELGIELSVEEQFSKDQYRFFEFDPVRGKYVDDSTSTLWFKIYSDAVEVIAGTAYTTEGKSVTIPKTIPFVGNNEISYFQNNIPLSTIATGTDNYIVLNYIEKFTTFNTHPKSGNYVATRIQDAADVVAITEVELSDLLEDNYPLILASVKDNNVRDASELTGTIDLPGQIDVNQIIIINPSETLLSTSLVGRIFVPDTNCNCAAQYRIARTSCQEIVAGDLDSDGKRTIADISLLLNVAGNTINSATTEREIFTGDLDLLDFIKSDLNNDSTVDGEDIELLEDAIDGYINFSIPDKIKVLTLTLENVLSENDYPVIFTDTLASGSTVADSNEVEFVASSENIALMIRAGDLIEIATDLDAGTYLIATKSIDDDGVTVTLTVTTEDGDAVTFVGTSGFDVIITSGSQVNTFADNNTLLNIPFEEKEYAINFFDFPFSDRFIEICDLRRFVDVSFIEERTVSEDECNDLSCDESIVCAPVYVNQKYFAGDIYLPNGQILSAPGVPHSGDYEYVNILMPLPPGTINDCAVNIYENFIKVASDCKTASGYPALKYSDGTFVGTDDSGSVTDLALNRVKISSAIASLYVDALVDGYAVDGYADAEFTAGNEEAISEQFIDFSYNTFDDWSENTFNDGALGTVTHPAGPNEPAIFDITTIAASGEKFVRLDVPLEAEDFEDDFIVDFKATRIIWPDSTLLAGEVSSFATFEVSNLDGSGATLKLGWKVIGGSETVIFYSGSIRDTSSAIVDSFNHTVVAPENIGDEVLFRLRRIDDTFFAYYIIPGEIDDSTSDFGQFIRIGTNPDVQPGDGTILMSFELAQQSTPTGGKNFIVYLNSVVIRSEYTSDDSLSSIVIGRNNATDVINRLTANFQINLNTRTNIVNAILQLPVSTTGTITDTYNIIPLAALDADNLGEIFNIPETQNSSLITSFIPGTIVTGDVIEVDITGAIIGFLADTGHIPGFIKGLVIEPSSDADSNFTVSNSLTLIINYEDITSGVVFQVGLSVDPETGIATLNTKNILYDAVIETNRTVINFGVHLKKAGFKNQDLSVSISDLARIGIGTCQDTDALDEDDECFFIVGSSSGSNGSAVGTFIEGPFPCTLALP